MQTSSIQAEFGRTGGGVLNVTTKMGTNQFHGALYEYFRTCHQARNTTSTTSITPMIEAGASIGQDSSRLL